MRRPTELPHAAHRYSCSSPSGKISSSLSRTGLAAWHRAQNSDEAWKSSNDSAGIPGLRAMLSL